MPYVAQQREQFVVVPLKICPIWMMMYKHILRLLYGKYTIFSPHIKYIPHYLRRYWRLFVALVICHEFYNFVLVNRTNVNQIISDRLPELAALCKKHRVKTLYLFGSANTDAFNENSDIDFLVNYEQDIPLEEYADNFFDLMYALEDLFGRKIDLVTENSLSNPYFIREIEFTKQLIYTD